MRKSIIILSVLLSVCAIGSIVAVDHYSLFLSAPEIITTPDVIQNSKPGNEGGSVSGWVKITVIDEFGNIKQIHEDHNLIHTVGLGATSDLLFGTTHVTGETTFNYIGVGTSAAALSAAHTDCQAPTGSRLQDASVTNSGSNGAVINQSWVAVLGAVTIEEVCLFDAVSLGNMYARQLTGSIVVAAPDTVNVEWTVTFADSDAS